MSKSNQGVTSSPRAECTMLMELMLLAGQQGLLERSLQDGWDTGKITPLRRLVTRNRRFGAAGGA